MRRFRTPELAGLLAVLAVAGCGRPGPVAENAENAAPPEVEVQPPDEMTGAGDVEAANATTAEAAARPSVAQIPPALRGRWALSPADCVLNTPSPSVLIVTGDALRFQESVARPVANVQTSPDTISGEFAFEGEGERWTRHQTLQIQLQDKRLVRTERDPIASYAYVRCSG